MTLNSSSSSKLINGNTVNLVYCLSMVMGDYRQAKKYHPDRNPSASAHEKFQEITKAYETISEEIKQKEIDAKR